MLEPRRSRYLRALGIDIYVPRRVLPGALPSQGCTWEAAPVVDIPAAAPTAIIAATAAAVPALDATATAPREIGADLSRLAGELQAPATRRAVADKPVAAPVAKSAVATPSVPKIALGVAVGGGFLIVDDAPATAGERSEYLRLLGNILFALRSDAALAFDVFLWPMLKQPQLDQSEAAARETLAAHLQSLQQRHAVHTVLLLGASAQQWCAGSGDGARCVASTSALACLRDPASKRQLWNDIRHLAAVH